MAYQAIKTVYASLKIFVNRTALWELILPLPRKAEPGKFLIQEIKVGKITLEGKHSKCKGNS
jgi:hypothetical protein